MAEKVTAVGIPETERNIANKISQGGFTGAFLIPMSDRNRGDVTAFGRLAFGVCMIAAIIVIGLSNDWRDRLAGVREEAEQVAQSQCAGSKDCDEKALRLQARELVSTEALLDLTFYQSLLNFLGLLGLGLTVWYARHAWVAAKDSADADNHALRLTREAMIGERRPWVHISVDKSSVLVGSDGEDFATLFFRVENLGRHPAIAVSIRGEGVQAGEPYKLSVPDRLIDEDRAMEAEVGAPHGFGITLFPNEAAPIGRVYAVNRKAHPAAGLVAGYVSYRSTITNETHYTPWAFEVRYAPGEAEREVEATAIKFYLTTSPT